MPTTQELLRQRFVEACAERDTIQAKAAPIRKAREDILVKASAMVDKALPLWKQILEIEAPLYGLHNEIATISRALSGKTSSDAA